MHIGLIGGIGPAATEYYYRGLIERHAGSGTQLELTIAHADVHELARNRSMMREDRRKPLSSWFDDWQRPARVSLP